jgi:hypothetical protein
MTNEQREQLKAIERENQYGIGCVTLKKWKIDGQPKHSTNRMVRDCYSRPSVYKTRAEHFILQFMSDINTKTENLFATDYTVISYNTNMFTCGFMVYDQTKRDTENGGLVAYYYFTKTRSERYEF